MLKVLTFAALIMISNAYALTLKTVTCSPKAADLAFVVAQDGANAQIQGLIQRAGDSMLPADSCYSYKQAPKEVKANIKSAEGVVGICVFITSDDGSGDMAVLKKEGAGRDAKLGVYFKQVLIDSPNKEMGDLVSCN